MFGKNLVSAARVVVLALIVFLVPDVRQPQTALAATIEVSGEIVSDTTWTSGNVYVATGDVRVVSGVTLTIQPGAIIKFQNERSLLVDGNLQAVGTASQKVYFTSWHDDSVGGDTNGDGGATTPDPNDPNLVWGHIRFGDGSDDASRIEHVVLRYGGNLSYYSDVSVIEIHDAAPTIQNNLITQNRQKGIEIFTSIPGVSSTPVINNNTISANLSFALSSDVHSSPQLADNTFTNNTGNGMEIRGGTIQTNVAWNQTQATYVVTGNVSVAAGGGRLMVAPGMVVKFQNDRSLLVDGNLQAVGTASQRVYFTSWHDDSVGGDTNGDGGATTPDPNDPNLVWGHIRFGDGSDDASRIEHVVLRYGGNLSYYSDAGSIEVNGSAPTIQNSEISRNRLHGISISSAVSPAQPSFACLDIEDNLDHGLYNATPSTVINAANLWWGNGSGPQHPTLNPNGTGNKVSDGVAFRPWLRSRCASEGPNPIDVKVFLPLAVRQR